MRIYINTLTPSALWGAILLLFISCITMATAQSYGGSPASLLIGPPPMILDEIDPTCWNFTYGNWRVQEFYSPNYPGEYLNNTDCILYLEAPSGFRIHLDFREKFILEQSEDCKYDYLEVRDGPFAYSPPIGRYCGAKFPPLIRSKGRYLWMRFKTDDLLQYGGFKAIYSYHKEHTQNDGTPYSKAEPDACRIPVKLSSESADGVLTSEDVPVTASPHPQTDKDTPVDCTWEIYTDRGREIQLRSSHLDLPRRARCEDNQVTLYERTTLDSDVRQRYCKAQRLDVTSDSNRVFVRLFSSSPANKPDIKLVYSLVRRGKCNELEFRCGGFCMPASLLCNGVVNCKDRSDERGCERLRPPKGRKSTRRPSGGGAGTDGGGADGGGSEGDSSGSGSTPEYDEVSTGENQSSQIPLHIIILGAVGGVILTAVSVSLCVMCHLRRKEAHKRREDTRHQASQRNALEMAVCNSSNTTMSLSQHDRTAAPSERNHHMGYQRAAQTPPGKGNNPHRYSMTGDGDVIPDQMTESGNYKRFLELGVPGEESNVQPGYPTHMLGLTTLESHLYPGYTTSPQWQNEDSYPYGSLNRTTPFLGLSKPLPYSPDGKYHKSGKIPDNEITREHSAT
ncbi:uncharacterized protein LOC101845248 [Aplysia californica]|uniref:Uncharacterized protein LOC101845248 n=1 Tax=Aplysia californica TaxID=6500 RepID=A0ABM1A2N6_APLCA|nr:uncharacterized protein LOC101845248 [Aplysia californica]